MRLDYRDISKRPGGSYPLGVNVRSRNNTIQPAPNPVDVTHPFWETVQGHMGMGKWHVVIADGEAWIKDSTTADDVNDPLNYRQLTGYTLSTSATEVFMEVVPLATLTYMRQLSGTGASSSVILQEKIPQLANGFYNSQGGGLPCMIVQDGTNQPMLIHPDASGSTFTCRRAKRYDEWTRENPEYVPIGYNMLYVGNVLYIVGKSNYAYEDRRIIFRSVSGRPLDFMVNIRQDGTAEPLEADGGARTVAHAPDFDELTCLSRINTSENNFLACTRSRSWIIQPNRDNLIFGEPTFPNDTYVGPVGAISQQAVTDLLNDTAVIGPRGIRSFNAVSQTKSEAKQSILTAPVSDLFSNIIQTSTCCATWDSYTLFGLTTRYGPGILVYDNSDSDTAPSGKFVSLDMFTAFAGGPLRQFARCDHATGESLYLLAGNKLLRMYAGTTYNASIYVGDFATRDLTQAMHGELLILNFVHSSSPGNTTINLYTDGQLVHSDSRSLEVTDTTITTLPFGNSDTKRYAPVAFNIANSSEGNTLSFYISWDNSAELTSVDVYYNLIQAMPIQTRYNV